jgi:uncharacterized protein involved in tolerance to divalent cations
MRNTITTTLSMVAAVITVAVLVAAIAATTVNEVNSAYAWNNSKKKQTEVIVKNKCANVDDENKRTYIEDVRCEINHDGISGTGLPLLDGIREKR